MLAKYFRYWDGTLHKVSKNLIGLMINLPGFNGSYENANKLQLEASLFYFLRVLGSL